MNSQTYTIRLNPKSPKQYQAMQLLNRANKKDLIVSALLAFGDQDYSHLPAVDSLNSDNVISAMQTLIEQQTNAMETMLEELAQRILSSAIADGIVQPMQDISIDDMDQWGKNFVSGLNGL